MLKIQIAKTWTMSKVKNTTETETVVPLDIRANSRAGKLKVTDLRIDGQTTPRLESLRRGWLIFNRFPWTISTNAVDGLRLYISGQFLVIPSAGNIFYFSMSLEYRENIATVTRFSVYNFTLNGTLELWFIANVRLTKRFKPKNCRHYLSTKVTWLIFKNVINKLLQIKM